MRHEKTPRQQQIETIVRNKLRHFVGQPANKETVMALIHQAQKEVQIAVADSPSQGWECPRCHRVWAPSVKQCECGPEWEELKK